MAGTEVTQKTAQKAHKLFSYLWDSAKIVGENVATVAEEVTGAILTNPADITDGLGSGPLPTCAYSMRRQCGRKTTYHQHYIRKHPLLPIQFGRCPVFRGV
eukprot:TRINITY_DN9149_c0_g1_i2.p2 TRINITY_DN9149_c0_g1~~TRINITY_DN9149_c0_g1_i2.p2  ORF type:complete len:101 (+),score=9.02 TRINITY_DN9149_c0_g1_i2:188-490(+)